MGDRNQHMRYVELCALLTADALSHEDLHDLNLHLENCRECRLLVADFQRIVRHAGPLLIDHVEVPDDERIESSHAKSRKRLLAALENSGKDGRGAGSSFNPGRNHPVLRSGGLVVLLVVTSLAGYFAGSKRHSETAIQVSPPIPAATIPTSQISDLTKQRVALEEKARRDSEAIDSLSAQIRQQARDLVRLKKALEDSEAGNSRQSAEISAMHDENASVRNDRDNIAKQLKDAETSLASLNQDVSRLQAERAADLLQSTTMQKTIEDLTAQVNARDSTVAEQRKFLSLDRDIRELMGARDLYVADVFDVDQNGHSRKPFGRVFYTKNKSLVFYAFDLDKQPGIRDVKTFQAWGQNSADKDRPVNMGIFYMDNEANRRWVLKFDNPKVMQEIDAVFVTVEPKGGSDKPSGKQLMYAFLRTTPNHP